MAAAAEWMGLAPTRVESAARYYDDHRQEVDAWIERVDRGAREAEKAWRRQDALG